VYIRFKRIKKDSGNIYEYAYLVGSVWRKRKKQAKQLHSKFLGRSYEFEKILLDEFNLKKIETDAKQALKELIGFQLIIRGFVRKENIFMKEGVVVNLDRGFVHYNENEAVVKLENKGLCSYSLEELFKFEKIESVYEGKLFIKALKECGIKLSGDELYYLVEKMNRDRFENGN